MSEMNKTFNELRNVRTIDQAKVTSIIEAHAIGAAVAGLAGGVLPGVASVIAVLTSTGAIWSMYYRICGELDIKVSQNMLKTVGSAVLTNIVTQLGGMLALELVASFVPGLAVVASAAVCYGVTVLAGKLFLEILTRIFKAGKNPETMTEAEYREISRQASSATDCKGIFKDAQKEAREKIRNGEITRDGAK